MMKQYVTNGRFDIAGFGRLCDVIHVIELCISTHAEMKIFKAVEIVSIINFMNFCVINVNENFIAMLRKFGQDRRFAN